jgi:hypothetical protein
VSSKESSIFVSTSKSLKQAVAFTMSKGRMNGYVYKIEGAPGGIDVNKTIGLWWMLKNAFPFEREIAFAGGIDEQFITQYREHQGGQPAGDWKPFPSGG